MAKYRAIDVRIWFDDKFPALSDDGKLLFFYFLTNPRGTMLGLAFQGKSDVGEFLGWGIKRVRKTFEELFSKKMISWDSRTNTIFLKNFLEYNPISNPNQVIAAIKSLDEIPFDCPFFNEIKAILERADKPFLKPLLERLGERLPKPFGKPLAKPFGKPFAERLPKQKEKEKPKEKEKENNKKLIGPVETVEKSHSNEIRQNAEFNLNHLKNNLTGGFRFPEPKNDRIERERERQLTEAKRRGYV